MQVENFKRAKEIEQMLQECYKRRDELLAIEKSDAQIKAFSITSYRNSSNSWPSFKIEDSSRIDKQPEFVKIVMMASVFTLRAAYEKEIKKLEEEFEKL
jgi:hypothetical protein